MFSNAINYHGKFTDKLSGKHASTGTVRICVSLGAIKRIPWQPELSHRDFTTNVPRLHYMEFQISIVKKYKKHCFCSFEELSVYDQTRML